MVDYNIVLKTYQILIIIKVDSFLVPDYLWKKFNGPKITENHLVSVNPFTSTHSYNF